MSKYIQNFQNHSEYLRFTQTVNFIKPNVSNCLQENNTHYNPQPLSENYLTFVALEDTTFTLSDNAVSYSVDYGETWTELAANTATSTIEAGNGIMWRGNLTPNEEFGIGTFSSTGKFEVKGNPMSLLYGDDFKGKTDLTVKDYAFAYLFNNNTNVINAKDLSLPATTLAGACYYYMFGGCTSLITAPELPATTLATYCYSYMFYYCTSLTIAPELTATTLASNCYEAMFYACTGLTTAPELPATTLATYCYSSMFSGCSNLTSAPELPATTLASYCYSFMFNGCTSLTTAPELPATTLATYCYSSMFQGCTSLTTAPELPATTLVSHCYYQMFSGCSNLTTAPELPATTLVSHCYREMFYGCAEINGFTALFTTKPGTDYTQNWVNGVAARGVFYMNSAATWNGESVRGVDGIPNNWLVVKV